MKKLNKTIVTPLVAVFALFANINTGHAAIIDATINNGVASSAYGTDPRGINASGYVNANDVADPSWDLRAMGWDPESKTLTIVSGFNPLTTNEGMGIGDIFITTNAIASPSRPSGADGYFTYSNPGFGACVNIIGTVGSALTYNVALLTPDSKVESCYYGQNGSSDPWRLVESPADRVMTVDLTSTVSAMTDIQVFNNLGINIGSNGGTNYVYSLDLSSLSFVPGKTVTLQQTEQCGNDLLKGQFTQPVPEVQPPAIITLTGLIFLLRKRRN